MCLKHAFDTHPKQNIDAIEAAKYACPPRTLVQSSVETRLAALPPARSRAAKQRGQKSPHLSEETQRPGALLRRSFRANRFRRFLRGWRKRNGQSRGCRHTRIQWQ